MPKDEIRSVWVPHSWTASSSMGGVRIPGPALPHQTELAPEIGLVLAPELASEVSLVLASEMGPGFSPDIPFATTTGL
jgi:hypothetical protein